MSFGNEYKAPPDKPTALVRFSSFSANTEIKAFHVGCIESSYGSYITNLTNAYRTNSTRPLVINLKACWRMLGESEAIQWCLVIFLSMAIFMNVNLEVL